MLDKILHESLKLPYKLHTNVVRQNKHATATIILLHGLASSNSLWTNFYSQIPEEINIISVDLLGHGVSPRPSWNGAQTLQIQAKSLYRSLKYTRYMSRPIILVGHSLGALVATEFARMHQNKVNYLVLVSPPIYTNDSNPATIRERILKMNYNFLINNQDFSAKIAKVATKAVIKGGKEVTSIEDFMPLVESLDKSILKQDTFDTLNQIKTETKIIYGLFDPLVIGDNIKKINNQYVSSKLIPSSHDIGRVTANHIKQTISNYLLRREKNA